VAHPLPLLFNFKSPKLRTPLDYLRTPFFSCCVRPSPFPVSPVEFLLWRSSSVAVLTFSCLKHGFGFFGPLPTTIPCLADLLCPRAPALTPRVLWNNRCLARFVHLRNFRPISPFHCLLFVSFAWQCSDCPFFSDALTLFTLSDFRFFAVRSAHFARLSCC